MDPPSSLAARGRFGASTVIAKAQHSLHDQDVTLLDCEGRSFKTNGGCNLDPTMLENTNRSHCQDTRQSLRVRNTPVF